MEINFRQAQYDRLTQHLRTKRTEQVAFLFLKPIGESQARVEEIWEIAPEDLEYESEFHAEITSEIQAKIIKYAWDHDFMVAEAHSHPGGFEAGFSPSDLAGLREFVPHLKWRLNGRPYFALVFGETDFDALGWVDTAPSALSLVVDGKRFEPTNLTINNAFKYGF